MNYNENQLEDGELVVNKKNYAKESFILALTPIIIVILGFLVCLIASGGGNSDNDGGAVWWVFILLLWIMTPVTFVMDIISIIFGIKALKIKNTLWSWSGIIVVLGECILLLSKIF